MRRYSAGRAIVKDDGTWYDKRYRIRINGEPLFEVDRLNQVPKMKIKNSMVRIEDLLTGEVWEREHCNSLSNFLNVLMDVYQLRR